MNLYVTPEDIRRELRLDTQNSMPVERLAPILEETCRYIDNELGRFFYVLTDTRYYDGPGGSQWWVPDDVISITSVKWDSDEDGVYETTLVEGTDFVGWPYNGEHFRRLDVLTRSSQIAGWPSGQKALEIVGKFGWGETTESTGDTVQDNPQSSSSTTLTVTSGANFAVGDTLLIETEQQYVSDKTGETLTVVRGVNGTTAAAHNQSTAISRYTYPAALQSAIKMEAARWYREISTGFAGAVASMNESGFASFRATYPAIMARLATFRTSDHFVPVGF